jgi:glycerol-3-phosphate dehydrogenase (NAD(P)+)
MSEQAQPPDARPRVAVIGGGNFGTVIASIVAARGHDVRLWLRDPEQAEEIRATGENRRYLPGHPLPANIRVTTDLTAAVSGTRLVFVSVPSAAFAEVAAALAPVLDPDTCLVSTTKGIAATNGPAAEFRLMSELLAEHCPGARIGVLSGPNIAEEIAGGEFTGTVIASPDAELCELVQETVHSRSFRVYSNPDMYGVELAGALKNIYAIASGMASALGAGQNTIAMLVTRGLGEMSRLAARLGADPLTFLGLAGVGDLMVTCTSPLSRNYQLGLAVGRGLSLEDATRELGRLAEGVNTVDLVHARALALGVEMPIVRGLHQILREGRPLAEVLIRLMLAEQRDDVAFVSGGPGPAA